MDTNQFLKKLRIHRPEAYRHTWDVYVEKYFWEDYDKLNNEMKECTMMHILVIQNSQTFPGKQIGSRLYELDIGRNYKIIYGFSESTHEVTYHFVRKQGKTNKNNLKITLPKIQRDPNAEDGYESIIRQSYERENWFENITKQRLLEQLKEKGVIE